jgi:hypothetical protein
MLDSIRPSGIGTVCPVPHRPANVLNGASFGQNPRSWLAQWWNGSGSSGVG